MPPLSEDGASTFLHDVSKPLLDYTVSHPRRWQYIGFEVPIAVVMRSPFFWDITLCSPLKVK
jgi:hypothetical protein